MEPPNLCDEASHVCGRVSNEVNDGIEPRIGRCELPGTEMHVDVHLIVHCRVIANLNEAAAADAMPSFQHGIPRCGHYVERSHGTLFDRKEFRVRQGILHDRHPYRARARSAAHRALPTATQPTTAVPAEDQRQIRSSVRHDGAVSKRRPSPGSVIQVPLPDGRFAYARVYRDATVCFYRYATRLPGEPPLGLRDFAFCVGVYDDVVASWEVVGVDSFSPDEDNGWPPASGVKDPISGSWRIYHRGAMRAATEDEARDLEPAAVWDEHHLLPRLAEGLSES